MRWPFVSRVAFAVAEAEVFYLRKQNDAFRADHSALLEKYHTLKLQGAVAVPAYTDYIETPLSVDEADALRVEQEQEDG